MEVVASLSQGRKAAAQCGLFTHKSVPVIFEPPCISEMRTRQTGNLEGNRQLGAPRHTSVGEEGTLIGRDTGSAFGPDVLLKMGLSGELL